MRPAISTVKSVISVSFQCPDNHAGNVGSAGGSNPFAGMSLAFLSYQVLSSLSGRAMRDSIHLDSRLIGIPGSPQLVLHPSFIQALLLHRML